MLPKNGENVDRVRRSNPTSLEAKEDTNSARTMPQNAPGTSQDDDNSLSPAVLTAIMVSIGIGLFTVCATVIWLCRAQLNKKGNNEENKSVLVENEDNIVGSDSNESSPSTMNDSCADDKETSDSTNMVDDSEVQPENIKEPASIETDLVDEEELNVRSDVDCSEDITMTEKPVNIMENGVEEMYVEEKSVVNIGLNFAGNISIASNQVDELSDQEFNDKCVTSEGVEQPVCNSVGKQPHNSNINVICLQECVPDYQTSSISVADCVTTRPRNLLQQENVCEQTTGLQSPSSSLQHLAKINQPSGNEDGRNRLKSSQHNDEFMFPQDNFEIGVTTVAAASKPTFLQTTRLLASLEELPFKEKRKLELSRSFDSQQKILEKGCQLLQTRPRRSSLRLTGQDNSPGTKKYVHFPEDIRNIRKVHKYDSFDDSILLHSDMNDKAENV